MEISEIGMNQSMSKKKNDMMKGEEYWLVLS